MIRTNSIRGGNMDKINFFAYGYYLGDDLFYHVSDSIILNFKEKNGEKRGKLHYVKLRETMSNLLLHLLENAGRGIIRDDDLLTSVWDQRGLRGTRPRLWQVMITLKKKMQDIGIEQDFIFRVNGDGYIIRKSFISPLYCPQNSNEEM